MFIYFRFICIVESDEIANIANVEGFYLWIRYYLSLSFVPLYNESYFVSFVFVVSVLMAIIIRPPDILESFKMLQSGTDVKVFRVSGPSSFF